MSFVLPLVRDVVFKAEAKEVTPAVAAVTNADGSVTPGTDAVVASTVTLENGAGVLLVLESNWSQAVFANDFHTWLLNLIKRVNAFLDQYIADCEGPADQASFEAKLAEKLGVDANGRMVLK